MKKLFFALTAFLIAVLLIAPASADLVGGGSSVISVTSSPSGATATDLTTGETTTTPGTFVVREGTQYFGVSHTIQISKEGYYTYTDYTGTFEAGDTVHISAALTPIQTNGYISVSSSPSGASVYIDGIYKGTSPLTVSADIGSHNVRLEKSGYYSDYKTVTVYIDQTAYVSSNLEPQSVQGTLTVTSNPSGADVYIDDKYYGDTPLTVSLKEGNHRVTLYKSGCSEYATTTSIKAGSTSYVSAILTSSADAYLNIASNPVGASVYVDGEFKGNTQYSSSGSYNYLTVGPLKPGVHTIVLTYPGYDTYSTSFSLTAGEKVGKYVTMTPTEVIITSALHVTTSPVGASVFVDNNFKGHSPLTVTDISAGSHTVLVQYPGYNDISQTVSFTAGTPVELGLTMTPSSAPPAPTESPVPVIGLIAGLGAVLFALRRE